MIDRLIVVAAVTALVVGIVLLLRRRPPVRRGGSRHWLAAVPWTRTTQHLCPASHELARVPTPSSAGEEP